MDAFDQWCRDNGLHVTDADGVIVEVGTRSVTSMDVFCEQHGAWESEDASCDGAVSAVRPRGDLMAEDTVRWILTVVERTVDPGQQDSFPTREEALRTWGALRDHYQGEGRRLFGMLQRFDGSVGGPTENLA